MILSSFSMTWKKCTSFSFQGSLHCQIQSNVQEYIKNYEKKVFAKFRLNTGAHYMAFRTVYWQLEIFHFWGNVVTLDKRWGSTFECFSFYFQVLQQFERRREERAEAVCRAAQKRCARTRHRQADAGYPPDAGLLSRRKSQTLHVYF